jgi:hypothetical protein
VSGNLIEHAAPQMYQSSAGVALQMKMLGTVIAVGYILIASTGDAIHRILAHLAAPDQLIQAPVNGSKTNGRFRFDEVRRDLSGGCMRFAERLHVLQYRLALCCVILSRTTHDFPPGNKLKTIFKLSHFQDIVKPENISVSPDYDNVTP